MTYTETELAKARIAGRPETYARPLDLDPLRVFCVAILPHVKALWDAYEEEPRLNDAQPQEFADLIAMSLDDWWHCLSGYIDEGHDEGQRQVDALCDYYAANRETRIAPEAAAADPADKEARRMADLRGWLDPMFHVLLNDAPEGHGDSAGLFGFSGEVLGGGAIGLTRYFDNGAHVIIQGGERHGLPAPSEWSAAVIDHEGETREQYDSEEYGENAHAYALGRIAAATAEAAGLEGDPAEEPCPEHRCPLGHCGAACLAKYSSAAPAGDGYATGGMALAERKPEHARALELSRSDIEALHSAIQLTDSEQAETLEAILSDLLSDATGDDFTLSEEI